MLVPIEWLNEYVEMTGDIHEFAQKMTFSGTKVESVKILGEGIENVVAAKIISLDKHPNADKLQVSIVDAGENGNLQIITGATNVHVGDIVPIAMNGAKLPGGISINTTKMRGVESYGMMCSIHELNLSKYDWPNAAEDGIMILNSDVVPGLDIKTVLGLDDAVVDFEITPNRQDCLGILGVAREAAVTMGKTFNPPSIVKSEYGANLLYNACTCAQCAEVSENNDAASMLAIEIQDSDLCPRYTARVVTDVKIKESPEWMQKRLRNAGVRPINNIVDITNYVMLEMGQPMHAFDMSFVANGRIVVRRAKYGEILKTLDENDRHLDSSILVIADQEKPIAVAGVMGGANSEILGDTRAIIFESANFNGVSVRTTARKLGIRTEASSRFEKGLDPNMTLAAVDRAVQLVTLLEAGTVVPGCVDVYPQKREIVTIDFRPERINALLGTELDTGYMLKVLKSLEFEYDETNHKLIVPSHRLDVEMEADIAEEVARFFDYNNIKATLNSGTVMTIGAKTYKQKLKQTVLDTVVACGFSETYTLSFQNPKVYDRLNLMPDSYLRQAVRIGNPFSEETSLMRTTVIPDMIKVISDNYKKRIQAAEFFEISHTYHPQGAIATPSCFDADNTDRALPVQKSVLTLGAFGKDIDFFSLKGVIEEVFSALGINGFYYVQRENPEFYHPGRFAYIYLNDVELGHFGEFHPSVIDDFELPSRTYIGVLELEEVYKAANIAKEYQKLPKYPPVPRDLAFVVDKRITNQALIDTMKAAAGSELESVEIFDIYEGKQVPDGKKSVAYSLLFRATDKTLVDEDVNTMIQCILKEIESRYQAELRK